MRILIDIPEDRYKEIMTYKEGCVKLGYFETIIANGTPIPDNATNGNSVIKMFFKGIVRISSRKNVSVEFNKNWWDAPYQKGGK